MAHLDRTAAPQLTLRDRNGGNFENARALTVGAGDGVSMVRLAGMTLLGLSLPVAVSAAEPPAPVSPAKSEIAAQSLPSRSFALSPGPSLSSEAFDRRKTYTEVAPNTRLGIGIFGLKTERSHQAPVTAREIGTPRTRRAGVGISVRF